MSERDAYHVFPIHDVAQHEFSKPCHCGPRIESAGMLIVHNAWDEREKGERIESATLRRTNHGHILTVEHYLPTENGD